MWGGYVEELILCLAGEDELGMQAADGIDMFERERGFRGWNSIRKAPRRESYSFACTEVMVECRSIFGQNERAIRTCLTPGTWLFDEIDAAFRPAARCDIAKCCNFEVVFHPTIDSG